MRTNRIAIVSLTLVFLLSAFISNAQNSQAKEDKIQWMTFHEATAKAKQNPKKLYIDFYTSWCGWCKRMDATTFEDPVIIAYMNKNYYAVKFDAETHDTILFKDKSYSYKPEYKSNEFAAQMMNGQMSYPTSVYMDENLNEITPVSGYLTGEQLLPILKYFGENIYKTKKWEEYQAELKH